MSTTLLDFEAQAVAKADSLENPSHRLEALKEYTSISSIDELLNFSKTRIVPPAKVDINYSNLDQLEKALSGIEFGQASDNFASAKFAVEEQEGEDVVFMNNIPLAKSGVKSLARALKFDVGTFNRVARDTKMEIIQDLIREQPFNYRTVKYPDDSGRRTIIKGFYKDGVSPITMPQAIQEFKKISKETELRVSYSVGFNPESTHSEIKLILPSTAYAGKKGLPIVHGFSFLFSDIASNPVDLSHYTFQFTCSNGACHKLNGKGFFHVNSGQPCTAPAVAAIFNTTLKDYQKHLDSFRTQIKFLENEQIPVESVSEVMHDARIPSEFAQVVADSFRKTSPEPSAAISVWDLVSVMTNKAQRYSGKVRASLEAQVNKIAMLPLGL